MTKDDAVPVAVAPAKRPPINKYAFGCALLASMNSVLLGYGMSRSSVRTCMQACRLTG